MVSVSDYQREIDEINDRVNNLIILSSPQKSDEHSPLPGYLVFVFLAVLGFIIYLLTKLEWKKVN